MRCHEGCENWCAGPNAIQPACIPADAETWRTLWLGRSEILRNRPRCGRAADRWASGGRHGQHLPGAGRAVIQSRPAPSLSCPAAARPISLSWFEPPARRGLSCRVVRAFVAGPHGRCARCSRSPLAHMTRMTSASSGGLVGTGRRQSSWRSQPTGEAGSIAKVNCARIRERNADESVASPIQSFHVLPRFFAGAPARSPSLSGAVRPVARSFGRLAAGPANLSAYRAPINPRLQPRIAATPRPFRCVRLAAAVWKLVSS